MDLLTLREALLNELKKNGRKPQRVFLCSMSDIFHQDIPDDFILRVFKTMNECQQHTFIVLTKRADRMLEISTEIT